MGTKHWISAEIVRLLRDLPDGPLLDAFAGMGSIGEAVGQSRQIWNNDILRFPALVGRAIFCSANGPWPPDELARALERPYRRNLNSLTSRFSDELKLEDRYIAKPSLKALKAGNDSISHVGSDSDLERERTSLARSPKRFPYRMASITYAGGFFGLRQSIEIDSIRYAMDHAKDNGRIRNEQWIWLMVGLAQVLTRLNNSTGHFAQHLKSSKNNVRRTTEKRRRSVWMELMSTMNVIGPLGEKSWRGSNKWFMRDASSLVGNLYRRKLRPAVIYADPPYSAAQYSRYYHVLDELLRYRYPPSSGRGRYPDERHQAAFSNLGTVESATDRFIARCAASKADLIFSYPTNGLLYRRAKDIKSMLGCHYFYVDLACEKKHNHSTFGGSQAPIVKEVSELVFVASKPRHQ